MPIVEGGRTTHTTLECRNVVDSLRFYRDVMGLQVNQIAPGVGHVFDCKDQYAAVLQNANPGPQPFLNFYARPVAGAAEVDAAYAQIAAVRETYGIAELTAPAREDPARFGVASYGFYLQDLDGNWWRVEDTRARSARWRCRTTPSRAAASSPPGRSATSCSRAGRCRSAFDSTATSSASTSSSRRRTTAC